MKIVLVTNYFASHGGGIERVADEVVRHLAACADVDIDWFAADAGYSPPGSAASVRCHPIPSLNFVETTVGLPFPIWWPGGFLQLAAAIRQCDVVHIHDFLYLSNLAAFVFARHHRKPVVITQHIGNVPYDSAVLRGLIQLMNRTLGAWLLGGANQAVFISEIVREYFSAFTRFRRPALFRPNGVRTDRFRPADIEERRAVKTSLGFADDKRLILFVGRFVPRKGLRMVRALAEGTPELQWAMTGWGPLQPEEWRLSNLSVLRGIPQTSLAGYYRCADLLVLPSKGEGFPLVIQEAMACGTPALTNVDTLAAIPGVERFLHGETLEGPDAVDAWRRSIRRILEEQTEDGRLAVAEYAAREWAWDRVARAYCGIFSAVVGC